MSNDSVDSILTQVAHEVRFPVALQTDTKWIIKHPLKFAVGHRSREIFQRRSKLFEWLDHLFSLFERSSITKVNRHHRYTIRPGIQGGICRQFVRCRARKRFIK